MSASEIIGLCGGSLGVFVSITVLITWISNRKQKHKNDGIKEAQTDASIEIIKIQSNSILNSFEDLRKSNKEIVDKLDLQNVKITKLEQTVDNASLAKIPAQLAAMNESIKSAHKRLDKLENKKV